MTAPHRRTLPTLPPLDTLQKIHVIGICGTAMGTLAAMLKEQGKIVTGSDAMAYPPMSTWLESRGLTIQSGYKPEHIPKDVDLVVVGNVSRKDNPESVAAHERGLLCLSMPEVLRTLFFPHKRVLCVTGTHGKTTTASMLSWILFYARHDPSFFIGGVTGNFDANYRLGGGKDFVIEGDEYDTAWFDKVPKFWHYPATHALINNVEFDHADIYPDIEAIEHVFSTFAEQISQDGTLWVNAEDARAKACAQHARATVRYFGLGPSADVRAVNLRAEDGGMRFDLHVHGKAQGEVRLPVPAEYNVRNFLGAAALAHAVGVSWSESIEAIAEFRNTRRRQEHVGEAAGIRVIDDFAHHPTAVSQTLDALHAQYPQAKIHVAFEAKSNTSRRAIFQQAYVDAFAQASSVSLAPPWKKDALPEHMKLSIPRLVQDLRDTGVHAESFARNEDIADRCMEMAQAGDIIVVLSGSNFGDLPKHILARLQERERSIRR